MLSSPRVVPIFFGGDSFKSDVERFLSTLARSSYWSATTHEYGVGKLTVESSIVVEEPPPATTDDTDIEPWLAEHLDGTHHGWPALNARDIYVVLYPQTVLVTDTTVSCTTSAYHDEGFMPGGPAGVDAGRGPSFVYAVVSECQRSTGGGLDDITWSLSHELIEASTDPFVSTNPAFFWTEAGELAWWVFTDSEDGRSGFAEVSDLCNLEAGPDSIALRLDDEFEVQRSWSNAAASEQQDPCVPATGAPYFGAAPDLKDLVSVQLSERTRYDTYGLRVPLHESRIVDVPLFSTKPRPDFRVFAEEIPLTEGDSPTLKFAWDRQTGNDHDVLRLTITRTRNGPLGGTQIRIAAGEKKATSWTHGWMAFIAN